jgi:hypothetical protein
MEKMKIKLSFASLISMASLIGFCAGVLSVPIYLGQIFSQGSFGISSILMSILLPAIGLLNGALLGVMAYPVYSWLTQKIGFSYTGKFVGIEIDP